MLFLSGISEITSRKIRPAFLTQLCNFGFLTVTLYFSLMSSCHKRQSNHGIELINSGFLKYSDSSRLESLKSGIISSFNIYDRDLFKIAHIDVEELTEFSFDFFLPNLNEILAKRDLQLVTEKLNDEDNSFDIVINGDTIQLYAQKDLNDYTFWDLAPGNFFRKVNEILKSKDIGEQFYLLYGGNDLHVMLLTQDQFLIIKDYYKDDPRNAPYLPG